jgi:hypothetical protein
VIPAGVLRHEHPLEQALRLHLTDQFDMAVDAGIGDSVELDPRAGPGRAGMEGRVALALSVDPDERAGRDTAPIQQVDLRHCRCAGRCMGSNG